MMLYDQIASNKRKTVVLLFVFFMLLAAIGAAVGYLWLDSLGLSCHCPDYWYLA